MLCGIAISTAATKVTMTATSHCDGAAYTLTAADQLTADCQLQDWRHCSPVGWSLLRSSS